MPRSGRLTRVAVAAESRGWTMRAGWFLPASWSRHARLADVTHTDALTAMPTETSLKESSEGTAVIKAVLFDMDGVVTDTARAHAQAWKQTFDAYFRRRAAADDHEGEILEPFDAEDDYRRYVDGKPRYEGVASLLEARGIRLLWGDPDDDPSEETVCGLGNRKNSVFRAWLRDNAVRTYPTTLDLVRRLRNHGVRTGVFSASRNAELVLRNAAVLDLFDIRVDGRDASRLKLKGKPDPELLMEAASRLGVVPEKVAVVEDALAGVEAGERGRFALVVGVDRTGDRWRLRAHGADLVVSDLAELRIGSDGRLCVKTPASLPTPMEGIDAIRARLRGKRPAIFLDYDGTLTGIVEDPKAAHLSDKMRQTLIALSRRFVVAVISGRDLSDVRARVGLDDLYYAGSHGFDIGGPADWHERLKKGTDFLPDLNRAERALADVLTGIEGALLERKAFSLAVHYRRAASGRVEEIEALVDQVAAAEKRLRKSHGKKVFQLQPAVDWDKGRAVLWLLEKLDLDHADVVPFYIGDDLTDEDAFKALAGRGVGIVVGDETRPTAADYALADPNAVRHFLDTMIAAGERGRE